MAATIPLTPLRPWQPRLGAHRLIALFELRRRLVERDRVVADRDARDLGDVAILVQSRSMICQARCVDSGDAHTHRHFMGLQCLSRKAKTRASLMPTSVQARVPRRPAQAAYCIVGVTRASHPSYPTQIVEIMLLVIGGSRLPRYHLRARPNVANCLGGHLLPIADRHHAECRRVRIIIDQRRAEHAGTDQVRVRSIDVVGCEPGQSRGGVRSEKMINVGGVGAL